MKQQEELERQKNALKNLALASMFLALGAFIIILNDYLHGQSKGLSPIFSLSIVFFFCLIYLASKNNYRHKLSASLFLLFYFLGNSYLVYRWGLELPIAILFYSLVIILSGIIYNTILALVFSSAASLLFLFLPLAKRYLSWEPDIAWKMKEISILDEIPIALIFFIIALVSHLYNRSIKRSLKRALDSEAALKEERNLLEIKVAEKSKELKIAETEKLSHLYHLAELGRLARAAFHDLVNPLTALNLNLGQVKKNEKNKEENLACALKAAEKLETLIMSLKKQGRDKNENKNLYLRQEVSDLLKLFNASLKKNHIRISFVSKQEICLSLSPVKFSQVVSNLLSNAIEAYEDSNNRKKIIKINLWEKENSIYLSFKDHGPGIRPENIEKIFDPFFSTKKAKGPNLGLGLATIKNIIEKDFQGQIKVKSHYGYGAKFIIKLPKSHNPSSAAGHFPLALPPEESGRKIF